MSLMKMFQTRRPVIGSRSFPITSICAISKLELVVCHMIGAIMVKNNGILMINGQLIQNIKQYMKAMMNSRKNMFGQRMRLKKLIGRLKILSL